MATLQFVRLLKLTNNMESQSQTKYVKVIFTSWLASRNLGNLMKAAMVFKKSVLFQPSSRACSSASPWRIIDRCWLQVEQATSGTQSLPDSFRAVSMDSLHQIEADSLPLTRRTPLAFIKKIMAAAKRLLSSGLKICLEPASKLLSAYDDIFFSIRCGIVQTQRAMSKGLRAQRPSGWHHLQALSERYVRKPLGQEASV